MRHLIATSVAVALFSSAWFGTKYPASADKIASYIEKAVVTAGEQIASVILARRPKTVEDLQVRYEKAAKSNVPKVKVLIVPGHEPTYGGAEYGSVIERDLVVELSWHLARFLGSNKRYETKVTRDTRAWNPELQSYFDNSWEEINAWRKANKDEIRNLTSVGSFRQVSPPVSHIDIKEEAAIRLYGINKWANENDFDIVLHVHLNDHPGHSIYEPGRYTGFALYVPEKQYFNSDTAKTLADSIFKRLNKYNAVSDYPGEVGGIVEDQDLIGLKIKEVWSNYASRYFTGSKTVKDPGYFKHFRKVVRGARIQNVKRRAKKHTY